MIKEFDSPDLSLNLRRLQPFLYFVSFQFRNRDHRESGDYAGSISDIHSVTSRLSAVSVSS